MSNLALKIVKCFALVRQINHFYWIHTESDENNGHVSIENIETVIERIIRLPISKFTVNKETRHTLGSFHRFEDRIEIYVRKELDPLVERFVVVKELCHAIMDESEEYSTDAVQTIRELKKLKMPYINLEGAPLATRSEKLAEVMAVELIYPVEYRAADLSARTNGEPLASIAARRGVPPFIVEYALGEHMEFCEAIWKLLPDAQLPNHLEPL